MELVLGVAGSYRMQWSNTSQWYFGECHPACKGEPLVFGCSNAGLKGKGKPEDWKKVGRLTV
jgi:hypothetical protein